MSSSNCPAPTNGGGDDGFSEIQIIGGGGITLEQKEWLKQKELRQPKEWLKQKEWLKETRELLVVLATLAVSVTYQAGLNPPGEFWHDDGNGNQVMYDYVVPRYLTFYYLNATAFITSLVIVTLLLSKRFYNSEAKVASLILITLVDLMSLVGAYIAGSTRDMRSSIYIIVLTCFLFVCLIIYISRVLPNLCFVVLFMSPTLERLARTRWLPVTVNMQKRVEKAKAREKAKEEKEKEKEERKTKRSKKNGCICCGCYRASKYNV